MEFVVIEINDISIFGEFILFMENEGVLLCFVDRLFIVKMLSCEFDIEVLVNFENDNCNVWIVKMFGVFKCKNMMCSDDYELNK